MRVALTRLPSDALGRCELTHVPRVPIDVDRARRQHRAYSEALVELGCELVAVDAAPEHPDGVFVEDTAVVLDDVAVLARPGAPSRRGEVASVARALAPWRALVTLDEPATLDGGDVLRVGATLYVGRSGRTNHAGLRQLAHLVLDHGMRVKAAEVSGCLHLKSAVTSLGDGLLLVDEARVDAARFREHERVAVHPAEPRAANALRVGDVVLMSASGPRTAERVAAAGFEVRLVDVSELEKAEGALTCQSLIVDVRRS